jgi:hypothetical protein
VSYKAVPDLDSADAAVRRSDRQIEQPDGVLAGDERTLSSVMSRVFMNSTPSDIQL